jgi:hypothetical protein
VESIGAWGGQLITRQMRCRHCNSYFEALRGAFDPLAADEEPAASAHDRRAPMGETG